MSRIKQTMLDRVESDPSEDQAESYPDSFKRSPSDWRLELGTDPSLYHLVAQVSDWGDESELTREEYENALASLSFTLH